MVESILSIIGIIQFELMVFCVIWFLIGGIDDLLVDIIWMFRTGYRRLTIYRHKKPMKSPEFINSDTASKFGPISEPDHKNFHAIFIAAWQEADVIGNMLSGCENAWMNGDVMHRIYVGCYPNDSATTAQVINAAKTNPNISLVLCRENGPTTKGDCLNNLWRAMLRDELNLGLKAKSIILHDAEDRPHADSLAIFDRLIGRYDIVQLPVIPIAVPGSPIISGHYCDEFCESHGKAMVVREALGAALPLAGVGCAIERNCLGRFASRQNALPFNGDSVTEDYELGLHIGSSGRGAIMVRMNDVDGNLVGTRSCFPSRLDDAIRQKSRWTLGIALSGWDRLGWAISAQNSCRGNRLKAFSGIERRSISPKKYGLKLPANIGENWMRLRDRRAIFSAFTICCAYISMLLFVILLFAQYAGLYQISPLSSVMQNLILITSFMLLWRVVMRSAFLYYQYGWRHAWLAIPRMIISNVISILSARRAAIIYVKHCFGASIIWDKTRHSQMPPCADHDALRHISAS